MRIIFVYVQKVASVCESYFPIEPVLDLFIQLSWKIIKKLYAMYASDECLSNRNILQVVFSLTRILFDKHSSEAYIQQLG